MPSPDAVAAFYAEARELGVVMSDDNPTGAERPDPRSQQEHAEPVEMRVWKAKQALQPSTSAQVVQRADATRKAITGKRDDADLQRRVDSARRAIGAEK